MTERNRPVDLNGVPLREAADHLNTSVEAVRMRIRRKSLRAYKADGRWYVVLPERDQDATTEPTTEQFSEQTTPRDHVHETERDQDSDHLLEIIRRQDEEIAYLRRENERLAVAVVEQSRRIPALRPIEPPQLVDGSDASTAAAVDQGGAEAEPVRRPWWQFWR